MASPFELFGPRTESDGAMGLLWTLPPIQWTWKEPERR
jgi:hypothetical protein